MNGKRQTYAMLGIKILLALVFIGAGAIKLYGTPLMVQSFETIGIGQWFRYVTGIIEVGAAALLFVSGKQAFAAILIICTMIGAIIASLFILNQGITAALGLMVLAGIVLYAHRHQLHR